MDYEKDEKIRKGLIENFKFFGGDFLETSKWGKDDDLLVTDIIAWLEKQGQKPVNDTDEGIVEAVKDTSILDMVEPKFKVGDWVVWDNKVVCNITGYINEDKKTLMYIITDTNGMERTYSFNGFDNNARLWDIQDAKDGDVLVNGSNIFIFHFINDTRLMGYCHINTDDGRFYDDIGKNECFCLIDAVVNPATKEQRDTLFAKMEKSGYKWDAKKKELKLLITNGGDFCKSENCEQKPDDKIEPIDEYEGLTDFERTLADICIGWIGKEIGWKQYIKDNADVLLKIAVEMFNSVQDVPFERKSVWSEDDEVKINRIVSLLENFKVAENDILLKDIDWLKSLKQRIKE